jgi:PAS domain S-box-containing protein
VILEAFDSEQQWRLIVEAAPYGMLLVDENGTMVMVNTSALRQFGYEREELLGKSVEMLIPGPLRSDHRQHRAGFATSPQTRPMGAGRELFGLRKDGSEFAVEIGLTPIQTIKGMGVLASILDISERKRLETQLRQTERVAELGTLASGMAHEIGTPMNVIIGRAEYLLQRTTDEGMKKGLATIVTQVER